jgi:hypothetical protein
MVAILAAVFTDGLPSVEAAYGQAMSEGVHSSDVIVNILARQRDPGPAAPVFTPRCAEAPARAASRLRTIRAAQEGMNMERAEVLEMMGELKLHDRLSCSVT